MNLTTPEHLIAALSARGFTLIHQPNIVGREWVHGRLADHLHVTAVWFLTSQPPTPEGPGSGTFYRASLSWDRENRVYTTLEELLAAIDLPGGPR